MKNNDKVKLGILGPRGLVGEELLKLLEKKPWVHDLSLISTQKEGLGSIKFRNKKKPVVSFQKILSDRRRFNILLSLAETSWTLSHLKKFFGLTDCIVDESSAFRLSSDVPLVVPEINAEEVSGVPPKLIASPNCTTTVLTVALSPILKLSSIKKITMASYQAASGGGRQCLEVFMKELRLTTMGKPPNRSSVFPHPLANNLFPQIGPFKNSGDTEEEEKVVYETKKILGLGDTPVFATCVRVPVVRGHSLAVWVETEKRLSLEEVRSAYQRSSFVRLKEPYPTPQHAANKEEIFVGRLRVAPAEPCVVSLWACGDNLLKGAALNVLQIAELVRPKN